MPGVERLVAEAAPTVFWTDRDDVPDEAPPLVGDQVADLVVIGAGLTGLWAALLAAEQSPGRDIVILEAETAGFGASTRNGGFCEASLTHGTLNGLAHWPREIQTLLGMGERNLSELLATLDRLGIDAAVERNGQLLVANREWQVAELEELVAVTRRLGEDLEFLDEAEVRAEVASPTYLAGAWDRRGAVMVDPALLVWGLLRACVDAGVRHHDRSRVTGIESDGNRVVVRTDRGTVKAGHVIVATNAWAEPEREIRRYVIPVYDHVLMTEPLDAARMDSIGWRNRQGLADVGSQFHYYRLTADDRILWGGFDANYYAGNGMGPEYENRVESHELLARHFFETFPQLEGLGFTHRWAGPIGTTSKFCAAFGTKFEGRLAWVAGYTGLGVGASRFGARVALDLVEGRDTERTALAMVRRKPVPFPPEPLRNAVVQFTRSRIARSDEKGGRPGTWLRLLDRFGVGFDS